MSPAHRRLLASGRVASVALAAAVLLGVAAASLAVAQAWLLARTITGAFLDGAGVAALAVPLAALALVLGARAVLSWAAEVVAQRISGAVKAELRVRLLSRAVALGPRWAAGQASGELVLLATRGLDALDGYYGRYLPQLALGVVVPVAVVGCLLAVDVVAAITVALTVPLIPVFMALIGRMSEAHRRRRWTALSRLAHRFADVVAGLPTLRAYGRADAQVAILRRITDAYRTTTLATLRIAFLSALTLELLATISVALVAVGVGLRLATGGMSLEAGLFVLVLAPEAYLPLRRLGAELHASEEGLTAAREAFAVIDAPLAPVGAGLAPPERVGGLAIEAVSVEQPGRDVVAPASASLVVRSGEVVAVTGASGAGKSTLLAVVLGLLVPTSGRVRVLGLDRLGTDEPGVDVRDLDLDAWRSRVAWVPQAPWLFAGTVADDVRLGAPDASDAAVAEALGAVGLADVASSLALGERGSGLSSGQRRRVGIARALVRHAPVLLLDEPTAGLDAGAEASVMRAVRAAADGGAAVLLVAHRP
ncbi:MAG: thiol reductant ABC exporter subunit CydD, partial [Chloroflexi bacterium RBG_16_72_14]